METIEFEFVQGQESHTSYWGKFYVKGLEKFRVKEDFAQNRHDRHHSYQGYVAHVEDGTIFTIFYQDGSKRGTDEFRFLICKATDAGEHEEYNVPYGSGFLKGRFEVLAEATTKTKSPRLMEWWNSGDKSERYARHCAEYITKRGIKELPALAVA